MSAENYRENSTLLGAHNVSSRVSKESSSTNSSVSELHWLDYFETHVIGGITDHHGEIRKHRTLSTRDLDGLYG